MPRYWLFKSEPSVFSIDDLAKAPRQTTSWEGVRNYQARNNLRAMRQGDGVLFYHSSPEPPGVAGLAEVAAEAYPDKTALDRRSPFYDPKATTDDPRLSLVELRWKATFPALVPLETLRNSRPLAKMALLQRGSRLSVQPVTAAEWKTVLAMAKKS